MFKTLPARKMSSSPYENDWLHSYDGHNTTYDWSNNATESCHYAIASLIISAETAFAYHLLDIENLLIILRHSRHSYAISSGLT